MMRSIAYFVVIALIVMFAAVVVQAQEKMLAHDVYFTLNDKSPQAKDKLLFACKKNLSDQPGVVWFAAGPVAEELKRDVNDRDFDVALHFVFKNKAAHDQYQKSEKHLKLIEENKTNLKRVRVFDSYVEAFSHGFLQGKASVSGEKIPSPGAAVGSVAVPSSFPEARQRRPLTIAPNFQDPRLAASSE